MKDLGLNAEELLKQKAVSDRVTRNDAEQRIAAACLWRQVSYYDGQPDPRCTPVFSGENRANKRDRAGSSGNGSEVRSLGEPERKCDRKEY